jgi:predicted ATPase
LCEELVLDLFIEAEVEEYLRQRFGRSAALTELSQMIYRRTEGNALFMVNFVDYLLGQGLIAEAGSQLEVRADLPTLSEHVPDSLQQMLLRQIESLPADEQQLLGVASVSGMTFTAAEIAGVVERTPEEVEEVYDHLTRRELFV